MAGPALPPRTYPRSPLALYQTPAVTLPVPAYERYRVLLRFFRRLSFFLTLTGSGTALLVWAWRRYVLPRWTATNEARTQVAAHQERAWDEIVGLLRTAGRRGGGLALRTAAKEEKESEEKDGSGGGGGDEAAAAVTADEDEEVLDLSELAPLAPASDAEANADGTVQPAAQSTSEESKDTDLAQPPRPPSPPRSPRPTPLDLSALEHVDAYSAKGVQLANRSALPASSKAASALLTSLSGLNADIQTHAFLAADRSSSSRGGFPGVSYLDSTAAGGANSQAREQQQRASSELAQIKAEIRSLKGLLLSRRNFGYARPTTSVQ